MSFCAITILHSLLEVKYLQHVSLLLITEVCRRYEQKVVWRLCCQEYLAVSLKEWECVDETIVWFWLSIECVWVTVVQVYAPTGDRCQSIKDEFYAKLQDRIGSVA